MKIAVIDQLGNYGGVSRVIKNLLPALKEVNSKLEIDYFTIVITSWDTPPECVERTSKTSLLKLPLP